MSSRRSREGRDSQFNGINTIIKIGTETSVLNQLRQILVRAADGGGHPL